MSFPKRDLLATLLVVVAGLLYWFWARDSALLGLDGVRESGLVVLALGFAASLSAVVPGFDQVIHGSKIYLAATVVMGLVALTGGILVLVSSSELGFGVLIGAMGALWLVATAHHVLLARTPRPTVRSRASHREPVTVHGTRHRGI
jgi:hypothetical protein